MFTRHFLKLWSGASLIVTATLTPWAGFMLDEVKLGYAIIASIVAFFTTSGVWADKALAEWNAHRKTSNAKSAQSAMPTTDTAASVEAVVTEAPK